MGVDVGRQQAVRTNEHVHRAVRKALQRPPLLGRRHKPGEHGHLEVKRGKPREERLVVLLRQDGGGAQHHDLLAVLAALEGRAQGHLGLAEAHVSAEQAVHGLSGLHVGLDVGHGACLVGCELVAEAGLHLLLDGGVQAKGVAADGGAARVEVHQVKRQLLSALAGLAGGAAPVGSVQAREARTLAVRAHVARDAVHLLKRHVELVAARVLKQEVVAVLAGHVLAHNVRKEGDAVRGVDDVVSRLEGEGHARGVHAAGTAAGLCRAGAEVAHREDRQARGGDDYARRHRRVKERDLAARQGPAGVGRRRVRDPAGVVLGRAQGLRKRDGLVIEAQLKGLAGRSVRHGKEHRAVVCQKLAHAAQQLGVGARDARLAHGQLRRHGTGPRTQDGREGKPLLATKVHLSRRRVEPLGADVGTSGGNHDLVHGAHAVVKEGARLGQDHQGVGAHVLQRRGTAAVEHGQVALQGRLRGAALNEVQVSGYAVVVLGAVVQGARGTAHRLVREGHLAAGAHRDGLQLADGLARGGHHAADAVDLVAKELQAHGRGGLGGPDVHHVAVDVEGAGGVNLPVVRIAHAKKKRRHVLEGHLVPHGKRAGGKVAAAHGRHAAQKRVGAGHHQALLARGKAAHGLAASADDGVVRGGLRPGTVLALRVAADHVLAQPCGKRARRAVGRLLAGDHQQARPRVLGPQRRQHQRAGGLRHGQRGVVSGGKLPQQGRHLGRGQQSARNAVDEHERGLSHAKRPRFHGTPARSLGFICGYCSRETPATRSWPPRRRRQSAGRPGPCGRWWQSSPRRCPCRRPPWGR